MDQAAVGASITATDDNRFADRHKGDHSVVKEGRDLWRKMEFRCWLSRGIMALPTKNPTRRVRGKTIHVSGVSGAPKRCAECGFDMGKQGPVVWEKFYKTHIVRYKGQRTLGGMKGRTSECRSSVLATITQLCDVRSICEVAT